eukprot:CCRYP_013241-RA/>CCRYP_013241-RA protein AED:0.00 eAED:0.00 QI:61/1/1/1/0/0/2/54/34
MVVHGMVWRLPLVLRRRILCSNHLVFHQKVPQIL